MRGGRVQASIKVCALATVVAVMLGLLANDAPSRTAFAADGGCADFDGDGFVHISDQIIFSIWGGVFSQVPPAPWQLDYNKDGNLVIGDQLYVISQFFTSTTCQTDPLPSTTATGGALAVDANGDNPVATDPVENYRNVSVGNTFYVAVQITANPGTAAYQARLKWDQAVFDLTPRTAFDNVVVSLTSFGFPVQAVGAGYIDLADAPYGKGPSSTFVGPVMQFEFTCHTAGTAELTLAEGRSLLAVHPSNEYKPTLASAEIGCFGSADGDGDGLPDDYEGAHLCLDAQVDDAGADPDGDGLDNLAEFGAGTDPCAEDSDGDSLTDGAEVQAHGTGPLTIDTDHDTLPDGYEVTHICLDPVAFDRDEDPDGDSLDNLAEFGLGTDPCSDDSDGDGLTDDVEVLVHGTDPNSPDTDGDGLPDDYEVANACLDVLVADGDADPDSDLLNNLTEFNDGTDPCISDTVGGVAELPAVAGAPVESGGGPGANAGVPAGVAAVAVGAVMLGGAGWYARRRRR